MCLRDTTALVPHVPAVAAFGCGGAGRAADESRHRRRQNRHSHRRLRGSAATAAPPHPAPWQVPPVCDAGEAALGAGDEFGLEGVVFKDPAYSYRPGVRSPVS